MRLIGLAVVLALGLALAPLTAEAQQAGKVHRVGVITPGSPPPGLLEAFREGLRELGYTEERNLKLEWRFADGKAERLPALAEELVRLRVDVIFAVNTPAARAAKSATSVIPIVIARLADPVKTGLVPSIARPGGNITGLSSIAEEVAAKRLELLKEALPGVSRIALMFNAENPGHLTVVGETARASTQLGLQLQTFGLRGASDVPEAFRAATRGRAEALFLMDDVRITLLKGPILEQATKLSWPVFAGLSVQQTDAAPKRLELLREVVPRLRRLAIVANADSRSSMLDMMDIRDRSGALGLQTFPIEIWGAEQIEPAIKALKGKADALYVVADPLFFTNRTKINALAMDLRLPTMCNFREYAEAGCSMSYGPNYLDLFRRAATYVDKILRGAKPADLPVQQPTKFELVHKSQYREGAWSDDPAVRTRPSRRNHPITVLDQRGRLLVAALGFAGCSMPSHNRAT